MRVTRAEIAAMVALTVIDLLSLSAGPSVITSIAFLAMLYIALTWMTRGAPARPPGPWTIGIDRAVEGSDRAILTIMAEGITVATRDVTGLSSIETLRISREMVAELRGRA